MDEDPLAPSALPTADSWQWFTDTGKTRAPAWLNEATLRSVEMCHFDAYTVGFETSSGRARDWFVRHLAP